MSILTPIDFSNIEQMKCPTSKIKGLAFVACNLSAYCYCVKMKVKYVWYINVGYDSLRIIRLCVVGVPAMERALPTIVRLNNTFFGILRIGRSHPIAIRNVRLTDSCGC